MKRMITLCAAGALALVPVTAALAQGSGLPGDTGRWMDGVFPVNPPPQPKGAVVAATTPAPPIRLALKAIEAIANGCKQYHLGAAVVNSKGEPILVYIPDGSESSHAYTAIRKAYTAITYKVDTSELVAKAQQDAAFAAEIKANPNLMAFKGGLIIKKGDSIIGAIGVSGAEPGGHDAECGMKGLKAIEGQLK